LEEDISQYDSMNWNVQNCMYTIRLPKQIEHKCLIANNISSKFSDFIINQTEIYIYDPMKLIGVLW